MKIQKDGDSYIVKAKNFVDLQESKDYFYIDADEYEEVFAKFSRRIKPLLKELATEERDYWKLDELIAIALEEAFTMTDNESFST